MHLSASHVEFEWLKLFVSFWTFLAGGAGGSTTGSAGRHKR